MKILILIIAASTCLFFTSCSTTTYVNLNDNSKEQIENKLKYDEEKKNVGAEVTLLLKEGKKLKGELLVAKDSVLIICTEYSPKEEELINHTYPINKVRNNEIQELTIEGINYLWTGVGYGAAGGAVLLGIIVYATYKEGTSRDFNFIGGIFSRGGQTAMGVIVGALAGAIAGGVVGYILSTDDVIFQQIPSDYDMSFLKPLARYPEEPEYLRAIKQVIEK